MVLGQSPNAYSSPVVLICATVIASVALVMLAVSVFLLQNSRKPKEPNAAAAVPVVQGNKARAAGPGDERRQIEGD
jgi:hypothetical protein